MVVTTVLMMATAMMATLFWMNRNQQERVPVRIKAERRPAPRRRY